MTPDRPSQTYTCHAKGCASGGTFEAAPEEWWYAKGYTPPRNCPSCREWIKDQIDETVPCASCGWSIPVSAKRKISFHKREGVWQAPEHCTRCLLDPQDSKERAQARTRGRNQKPQGPARRTSDIVHELTQRGIFPGSSASYAIGATDEWWMSVQPIGRKPYDPAYNHVIVNHGKQIGDAAGLADIGQVAPYLSEVCHSTDSSRFVEFSQNSPSGVVKLDIMTGVAIILEEGTNTPITAFCPSVVNILNKLDDANTHGVRWSGV
ncbi:hypothetical protein GCM10027414_04860 [Humibacter ginsengiterrae]